jgi:hypothetical protein
MSIAPFFHWRALLPTILAVVMVVSLWAVNVSGAAAPVQISSDTFTDASTQHQTEIEPYVAAFGSTIVSVFQAGRNTAGGSDGIQFATSTDSGATWAHTGTLSGIVGGTVAFATNPNVAFDAKHAKWLVVTEGLSAGQSGVGLFLNTSSDGVTWSTTVDDIEPAGSASWDKPALVCDNTATSPHYGNCYLQWDDFSAGQLIWLSTSSDGGTTWSAKANTPDLATGFSGQAVVTPGGTVVIPYTDPTQASIRAITSTTGGATWAASVPVASSVTWEAPPFGMGNAPTGMRLYLLASAGADQSGTVYVAWQENNFELSGCCLNDIVMSKSTNGGATWSAPAAITPVGSGNDAFLPALTADPNASGHLGLEYFYIPNAGALTGQSSASCIAAAGPTQCQVFVGFMSSTNGGTTWTTSTAIAGPMTLPQLAQSTAAPMGAMLGDYVTTAFLKGSVFPVFPLGAAPSGTHAFNEGMWAIPDGILVGTATPTATPTVTGTMSPTVTPTHTSTPVASGSPTPTPKSQIELPLVFR